MSVSVHLYTAEELALAKLARPRTTLYARPRIPGAGAWWDTKPQIDVKPLDPELGARLISGILRIGVTSESRTPRRT